MASSERDEQRAQYLRVIFDTIPMPALIVDADICIHDFNSAAEALLGDEPPTALRQRSGEAIHCVHAKRCGCGLSDACGHCGIRKSVSDALSGHGTWREPHQAILCGPNGTVSRDWLITANLLPYTHPPKALLILEDITVPIQHRQRRRRQPNRAASN
ncbi:MAG: PAS domain-containing protein [Verrucomicrobiota bacterium]